MLNVCCRGPDQFAVDSREHNFIICYLCGNTRFNPCVTRLLLTKEVGDLKPVSLKFQLDREVPSLTPRHMFLVCASSVPTIAAISFLLDPVEMVTSFPSQVTVTWGNRILRERCPFCPDTRSCEPSRCAFTPSGIFTILIADMISHLLINIPEQFAADTILPRLFV